MPSISDALDLCRRHIEAARMLYSDLSEELMGAILRLRDADPEAEAKGLQDAVRAHRKALQTVLDYELTLAKEAGDDEHGAIDLDAARTEVLGRLDRLAARTG